MSTKALIGGLIGGVVYFLMGFLLYGLLLAKVMEANYTCGRAPEDLNYVFLVIGNLIAGILLAYIFSKWASISTFSGGAMAGAVIGVLIALGYNFVTYAVSTAITNVGAIFIDAAIYAVNSAVAGGVIGWWLGRK